MGTGIVTSYKLQYNTPPLLLPSNPATICDSDSDREGEGGKSYMSYVYTPSCDKQCIYQLYTVTYYDIKCT